MEDIEQYLKTLRDVGDRVQYGCVVFEKWVCNACGNRGPCISELIQPVYYPPRGCLYPDKDGKPAGGYTPEWRRFENSRDPLCWDMSADEKDALLDYYELISGNP